MKIERINDNQIRCTLTNFDLSIHNLNLGGLTHGNGKARNLFREMIQKASNEVEFKAEDIPLMVEAIPLSNENVVLMITKIENPEELDTRFAGFSSMSEEDSDSLSDLASGLLEGAGELLNLLSDNALSVSEDLESPSKKTETSRTSPIRVCTFEGLDHISEAARVVGGLHQGQNTLYKRPGAFRCFLVLADDGSDSLDLSRVCNILTEYGTKIHHEYSSESYYQEYCEAVARSRALQIMAGI